MSKKSLATGPRTVVTQNTGAAGTTTTGHVTSSESAIIMLGSVASLDVYIDLPITDGLELSLIATSTNTPVINFASGTVVNGVTAGRVKVTLANVAGAGISLVSYSSKWFLVGETGSNTWA